MRFAVMSVSGVMVLQVFTDFLRVELGSCNETCVTLHDGNEIISIKVEETTAIQEEEDPLLIKLPAIKSEHEVSCRFVCE
jgi:hypothetical protein